eukprot:gene26922-4545_t
MSFNTSVFQLLQMANFYDTIPLQITIGTVPSPGVPFKVAFQNKASSEYFGPLQCNTPQLLTLSESFLWEQLLGTSESKRQKELVTKMVQAVLTGEESIIAALVNDIEPAAKVGVPIQTASEISVRVDSEDPCQNLPALNSAQLRLQTMMTSIDYQLEPGGNCTLGTAKSRRSSVFTNPCPTTQEQGEVDFSSNFFHSNTEDSPQNGGPLHPQNGGPVHPQNRAQDLGREHGQDEADVTMDNTAITEPPRLDSEGGKEPYSVLQLIQVTAKTWLDLTSGQTWLVITHQDVTKAEVTYNRLERITEAQLSILAQSFPKHVIDYMSGDSEEQGKTYGSLARSHEQVTILFMDIVGFTTMSKNVASAAVLNFLNKLFTLFDGLCDKHKVCKVETAGDCYIVSCGIMERDDNDGFVKVSTEHDHPKSASQVLDFAKDMLRISKTVNMPHNNEPVIIRIGMHTGSVVSGVIGTKLPKMESTANHGGIQVSADTFSLLEFAGNADTWEATGGIEVKGKGIMETFHLQMGEEEFDVNAIKEEYKDTIEKAGGLFEKAR